MEEKIKMLENRLACVAAGLIDKNNELVKIANATRECVDALNWALENTKPDRPELQSDHFNILTNAVEGAKNVLTKHYEKVLSEDGKRHYPMSGQVFEIKYKDAKCKCGQNQLKHLKVVEGYFCARCNNDIES